MNYVCPKVRDPACPCCRRGMSRAQAHRYVSRWWRRLQRQKLRVIGDDW